MPNWVRVGTAGDVPEGGCRLFEAEGCAVAVFRTQGVIHAIDNVCLHRGGPLNEGPFDGRYVTCPWHMWQYDVTTGKTRSSESVGVRRYDSEVRGADLFLDLE